MKLQPRDIAREVDELRMLKSLVRVYGEIASGRMRRSRDRVLYRREFLKKLFVVFHEVRLSYMKQLTRLRGGGGQIPETITTIAHNGKTVSVFLAANTRLYGDLIVRTFEDFLKDVKEAGSEAVIVGQVGKAMFERSMGETPYTFFEMPDGRLDREVLSKLATHLVPYEEIHVYYGAYKNPVNQHPALYSISSHMPTAQAEPSQKVVSQFLFEPSLEEVLLFFETEIFGTMLEQTVLESQLAKFASRFVAMDRAEQQIDKHLHSLRSAELKLKHQIQNRKQLNSLAAIHGRFS
jgi:F0F1-type ATP synthase gamma subunit